MELNGNSPGIPTPSYDSGKLKSLLIDFFYTWKVLLK